jgi:diadenylate cyclase
MMHGIWDNWRGLFAQVHAQDFVDLFLVWIVVYRILLLVKKSGAVQILSGLGILAIAYMVSIWLELITFNYILEKFFANLFVIVVILFQAEIRRALAQIGSNPFLSGHAQAQETYMIEELAKGLVACAQRGFGALVVIEREISLDYFIEEGRSIDGEVTSELIQSIFHPEGPLHDGAVLLRAGRVVSAGCFLPLSKNADLDKNLGTRHRAAIGLTEETDAYVFVVSEETRSVGFAHSGVLRLDMDHLILRQTLYELYGLSKRSERERVQA